MQELNEVKNEKLKRTRLSIRTNKNHLKFPLFTDDQIGFSSNNPVVKDANLIPTDADEDCETDCDILKRTVAVCKKDVLFALNKVKANPNSFKLSLNNHNWQMNFQSKI